MMACGQPFDAERLERVVDNRRGGFGSQAASPEFRTQVETELGDSFF